MIEIMHDWRYHFEDGVRRTLAADEVLFRREDEVTAAYLVLSGSIALERSLPNGDPLVLTRTGAGSLLAEASLFAERYHCDAVAREASVLLGLDRSVLVGRLGRAPQSALGLLADTSREVQRLRSRIEVLRLRRVSDRLTAWLGLHGPVTQGHWADVAEAIGVTPAALYRELARRRAGDHGE